VLRGLLYLLILVGGGLQDFTVLGLPLSVQGSRWWCVGIYCIWLIIVGGGLQGYTVFGLPLSVQGSKQHPLPAYRGSAPLA